MQIEFLAIDPTERAAAQALLGARLPLLPRDRLGVEPPSGAVLWIHGDPPALAPDALERLRTWLAAGGRMLLSGPAIRLGGALSGEPVAPRVERSVWSSHADPLDVRGVMALSRQPLFHRFPGGVYLTRASADLPRVEAGWSGGDWPQQGRVLGVEKRHVGCDATRAVLVEHRVGRGRLVSLGAPMRFADGDLEFDEPRARFVGDLIDYLMSDHAAERTPYWPDPRSRPGVRVAAIGGGKAPMVALPSEPIGTVEPLGTRLDATALAADPFFDLVARDGQAIYGHLRSGIDEVWARSFRSFRELRLAVAIGDGELVPLAAGLVGATVHPAEITWEWRGGEARLRLRLAGAADGDGFALVVAADGARLRIALTARTDLRAFWPYPAGHVGAIGVHSARGGASTVFSSEVTGARATLVCDRKPKRASIHDASAPLLGGDGGAMAAVLREFVVDPGDELVVSLSGEPLASEEVGEVERAPRASVAGLESTATITTGVARIDEAFARVRAKVADFVVPFDDRSGGLIAGHDRTRPGWFTGRPGYAWFFARDAMFCDHALLPLGERALARANLALCARFQDANGKVHHEVTPLGVVHHDAADATPMFVDAVGRYVAWTGDLEFARSIWPAVGAALLHLERFDRDGDGIYENARNGHGWMEGGLLAERVRFEIYQATFVWRAWLAAAFVADELGESAAAAHAAQRARVVFEAARGQLTLEDGSFAHAVRLDGSLDRRSAVTTVMPWLCGLGEPGHESAALRRFSSAAAQADWGSRMLPEDDPAYDPASYQAGSAWPLFTGWTMGADLRCGRPDSAWLRLLPLLHSVDDFAPGVVDEVLRGDVYLPRGIAAHQAWSHCAVIGAFVDGVLGLRLHAQHGRLALEPTLPGALDRIAFADLPVRGAVLSGEVFREADGRDVVVRLSVTGSLGAFEIAPFVPAPLQFGGVERDGEPIDAVVEPVGDGQRFRVELELTEGVTELRFRATPDLVLGVEAQRLAVGQRSRGLRFLGRRVLDEAAVALDFECVEAVDIPLRTPGRAIVAVEGAELTSDPIALRIAPGDGDGYRAVAVTLRF